MPVGRTKKTVAADAAATIAQMPALFAVLVVDALALKFAFFALWVGINLGAPRIARSLLTNATPVVTTAVFGLSTLCFLSES